MRQERKKEGEEEKEGGRGRNTKQIGIENIKKDK